MAKTDRAAFAGTLAEAEREMDALFEGLARDVGNLVLRAQGPEGTVPVERLPELQRQARRLVDAAFVGPAGQPFSDAHEPLAPYPAVIAAGQWAMIDLALARTTAILSRHLPEDVRAQWARRWQARSDRERGEL